MLEAIRQRKRIAQVILLILIVPFAFFGIEHYFSSGPSRHEVASVGSSTIALTALQEEIERQSAQMRSQNGALFRPELVRSQPFVEGVLWQLIERQLLLNEAQRLGIEVEPEAIRKALVGITAFQKEGVFDYATYEQRLRAQGLTPARFEALVAQDLAIERLLAAVQAQVVPPQTVLTLLAWQEEQRTVHWLKRPLSDVAEAIPIDEAALATYFATHAGDYQQDAAVQLAYVVLDREQVAVQEVEGEGPEARQAAKQRRFQELAAQLPELAFQAVDRLEPVAEHVGSVVETTELMPLTALKLRDGTPLPAQLRAAIESESGRRGENLEPLSLPDGRIVVVRVLRFEPARQLTLEEARAKVERDWRWQEAKTRLRQELETLAQQQAISWQGSSNVKRIDSELPATVVQLIFTLPVGKRQVAETIDALWLIEVAAVHPAHVAANDSRIPIVTELVSERYASVTYRAWLESLQARYPITIRREALKTLIE